MLLESKTEYKSTHGGEQIDITFGTFVERALNIHGLSNLGFPKNRTIFIGYIHDLFTQLSGQEDLNPRIRPLIEGALPILRDSTYLDQLIGEIVGIYHR